MFLFEFAKFSYTDYTYFIICLFLWSGNSHDGTWELLLSCVRLFCNPMDYSLPGSSVHGISQARILESVAISFSRGYSQLRDWKQVGSLPLSHQRSPNMRIIFSLMIGKNLSRQTFMVILFYSTCFPINAPISLLFLDPFIGYSGFFVFLFYFLFIFF